ncbi:MAG: hypothetical protein BWZ03_00617 [bacterium ADurb.BinA186]|nr:MAG: hypothetical protein BWZ03_00617 [bacterium ADurb.BinA186]
MGVNWGFLFKLDLDLAWTIMGHKVDVIRANDPSKTTFQIVTMSNYNFIIWFYMPVSFFENQGSAKRYMAFYCKNIIPNAFHFNAELGIFGNIFVNSNAQCSSCNIAILIELSIITPNGKLADLFGMKWLDGSPRIDHRNSSIHNFTVAFKGATLNL